MKLLRAIGLLIMITQISFKEQQKKFPRVNAAYHEKEEVVKKLLIGKKINSKEIEIFLRAFKKELKLEVWVKPFANTKYSLLTTYDFCNSSGVLGPKRKEGDLQIPEGIYHINHFNPQSNYHLSLGINYPNKSDKILSDKNKPGSAIYIHGNCVTVGCIPITDEKIKELYILAVEARNSGQKEIPVHIYPTKLDINGMDLLKAETGDIRTIKFWDNLREVFKDFEESKVLNEVIVDELGNYNIKK